MSDHPKDQRFFKYLDGEMSSEERQTFIEHLEDCEQCENRLDQLREEEQRLSDALADTPVDESVKNEVMDHIGDADSKQTSSVMAIFGAGTSSKALKIAASLIVFLGVGIVAYLQLKPSQQMDRSAVGEGQAMLEESVEKPEPPRRAEVNSEDQQAKTSSSRSQELSQPNQAKKTLEADQKDQTTPETGQASSSVGSDGKKEDKSAEEHFQMAMKLEKNAKTSATESTMAGAPRAKKQATSMEAQPAETNQQGAYSTSNQVSSGKEWSREDLEKANELLKRTKQAPTVSKLLKSRATIHLAMNYFRLGNWEDGVTEYEFWKNNFDNSTELPQEDRTLLKNLKDKYRVYRLKHNGWQAMMDGTWELTDEGIIRTRPSKREIPSDKRLLVYGKTPSTRARYDIKISMKSTDYQGNGGLAFGITGQPEQGDVKQYYTYTYEPSSGDVSVTRINDSTNEREIIWRGSRSLNIDEWVNLRLEADGGALSLYFNDELSTTLFLNQVPEGDVGLVYGSHPMFFKNFSMDASQ